MAPKFAEPPHFRGSIPQPRLTFFAKMFRLTPINSPMAYIQQVRCKTNTGQQTNVDKGYCSSFSVERENCWTRKLSPYRSTRVCTPHTSYLIPHTSYLIPYTSLYHRTFLTSRTRNPMVPLHPIGEGCTEYGVRRQWNCLHVGYCSIIPQFEEPRL